MSWTSNAQESSYNDPKTLWASYGKLSKNAKNAELSFILY